MSAYILITCRDPCRVLRDRKNNNRCLIAALSPGGRVCRVSPWGSCVCIGSLSRPRGAKHRFILQSYWLDKQSLVLHQAPAAVYEPFIDDSGKFVQPHSSQTIYFLSLQDKSYILYFRTLLKHSEQFTRFLFIMGCFFILFLIHIRVIIVVHFKCFSGLPRNSQQRSGCQT